MTRQITSVAVLGVGTMGSGIAAACASAGCRVLMLDLSIEAVDSAIDAMTTGRSPALEDPTRLDLIERGTFADDLERIADYDWICEAIVEDVEIKRDLFTRLEPHRREGSVISTNTSGIPLRSITEGMPDTFRGDVAVTHFFNPVKVMKLFELVPGEETTPDVIEAFSQFGQTSLGKGVVNAKDTVNFIGNRIGCFFMLSGLHLAEPFLADGMSMETIDAVLGSPIGVPPTGLYGLIDLIGLDVMELVGKNLAVNLPDDDTGHSYTNFPSRVQALHDRGQLGRKTGGGFYRMLKNDDGSRSQETFDLTAGDWRPKQDPDLEGVSAELGDVLFDDTPQGRLAWAVMGGTLRYAACLVPEIADDIVNVDRAIRWGFNWVKGPFEMLDHLGPQRVIDKIEAEGGDVSEMLLVLRDAGVDRFYRGEGDTHEYLGTDGTYHPVPPE